MARLKSNLQAQNYTVLSFRAETYHHLSDALTIEEPALLLLAGMGEQFEERFGVGGPRKSRESVWERLARFIQGIEVSGEIEWSSVGLKAQLRSGEGCGGRLAELLRNLPGVG